MAKRDQAEDCGEQEAIARQLDSASDSGGHFLVLQKSAAAAVKS